MQKQAILKLIGLGTARTMTKEQQERMKMSEFIKDLRDCVNRHSKESDSDTPDCVLATYLNNCLEAWNTACKEKDEWNSVDREQTEPVRPSRLA